MNVDFYSSFNRDLKKAPSTIYEDVLEIIENVEKASSLFEIDNCKKLSHQKGYYKIKLGSYRIGLEKKEGIIYFVRCLPRKDMYKFFP